MPTTHTPFRLGTCLGFILFSLAVQAQDLPLASVEAVPDGDAQRFDGIWSIMRPQGSDTNLTCHVPTTLISDGRGALVYRDIGGREIGFVVSDSGENTLWDGTDPQTAVWTGADSFILYAHRPDGSLATDNAMLYERCEAWPRESYAGAPTSDLTQFEGRWSEALPARRGGQPLEPQSTCDSPTTYTVAGASSLEAKFADGSSQTIEVEVRDGEIVFPNEGYPAAAVWVSPDRWHLHLSGIDRKPDWNLPIILERCPAE